MRLFMVIVAGLLTVPPLVARATKRPDGACEGVHGPSHAQLQRWTREYYPSLADNPSSTARLVVGFVLDERCVVIRHSVGVLPPGNYSVDVVLTLFPGLTLHGEAAGLADAVPPAPGRLESGSRLMVAWVMKRWTPLR